MNLFENIDNEIEDAIPEKEMTDKEVQEQIDAYAKFVNKTTDVIDDDEYYFINHGY